METKHTELPWKYHQMPEECKSVPIVADGPTCIGHIEKYPTVPPPYSNDHDYRYSMGMANAEFIVRACNSHDNMLKACLMALGYAAETSVLYNTLKAAIAKAENP